MKTVGQNVDFDAMAVNWDPRYHVTGAPMPANAFMLGLVLLDWDGSFRRRAALTEEELEIPFQYVEATPNWEKSANYASVSDIMGRFEDVQIYGNSGAQEFEVKVQYHAEALHHSDHRETFWSLDNIEVLTKRLQSLVYPQYDGNYQPPMRALLNMGNQVRNLPVAIKRISVENGAPYDVNTLLSMLRTVSISMVTSYPMWQGIGATQVYLAEDTNQVFAYEEIKLSEYRKYTQSFYKGG